jgi:hypothetical protein
MKAAGRTLSSSARRIQKELAEISLDPPCNCSAGPKGDNIYEWSSTIVGPSGIVHRYLTFAGLHFVLFTESGASATWQARPPQPHESLCPQIHLMREEFTFLIFVYQWTTLSSPPRCRFFALEQEQRCVADQVFQHLPGCNLDVPP